MAYVPLDRERARVLRDSATPAGPTGGHAATAGLLAAHDLAPGEDAEYTALAYAGLSALLTGSDPLRLVVAVEVGAVGETDDPFGRVELDGLSWARVTSLFADEPDSAGRIAKARRLAATLDFERALDDEQIEALLDDSDLLWFGPDEFDGLPEP